jgi:integrase
MAVKVVRDKVRRDYWWVRINHKGLRKSRGFATKAGAELFAAKIDVALKLGETGVMDKQSDIEVRPKRLTFKEYAERWLEGAGVRVKLSTLDQYRTRLQRSLPTLGGVPLTAITRHTIRELIGAMVKVGNRRNPTKPIARGTIREALAAVSAILATAVDDGLILANPCFGMGKHIGQTGATEAAEIEVFTREELGRLLALAETDWPDWYPFLLTMARTGMRLGEVIALEWRDCDFDRRLISVRRSCRRGRVSVPKNGKGRLVDMSQQLAAALSSLKTFQGAEAALSGHRAPERMFSGHRKGGVEEHAFQRAWVALLGRAELRYRKPHTLRHTFASMLIERGEPLPYVQAQLGHHSAAFTLKVYGHLMPRGARRAVDALDDDRKPTQAPRNHATVGPSQLPGNPA